MKNEMFFYSLVCIFLLFISKIYAQEPEPQYAGAFLELGIGARGMAMGEAYVSVADDGSAFYWNPAGAATLSRSEVSGMYASLFKGLVKQFHVGLTRSLYRDVAVSVNWIRLNVQGNPRLDSLALNNPRVVKATDDPFNFWNQFALKQQASGFVNSNDDAFFITLAKQNKINIDFGWQYFVIPVTIPIGLNVKLIRQNLFDKHGSALGVDFGTMFKFGLDDLMDNNNLGKISFGLTIKDIWNTKVKWNTDSLQSGKIKRSWNIGGSYLQPFSSVGGKLLVAYSYRTNIKSPHKLGFEYTYYERLAIRFGLSNEKVTAGIGLKISPFYLDYAFRSHELGGSHRINTSIRF